MSTVARVRSGLNTAASRKTTSRKTTPKAQIVLRPRPAVVTNALLLRRQGRNYGRTTRRAERGMVVVSGTGAVTVHSNNSAKRQQQVTQYRARRLSLVTRASGVASIGPSSEREGEEQEGSMCWASLKAPATAMAAGEGLGSSSGSMMGATLERASPTIGRPKVEQVAKTEFGGGSGGNGKNIHNGGGGGDDEDDDDYEFNDDEGGDEPEPVFVKPEVIPEVYDRTAINAVLAEWYRCLADLPAGLRMAVEMSFVSTSQLVRFLSMECRPTIARAVSRKCPSPVARAFVGRLMADPQFIFKLSIEQALTVYGSLTYEAERRGKRFMSELDLVALNTLQMMMGTFATVWVLAPSRSFGTAYKFRWQSMLHGLPHQMFEKSTPLRNYTGLTRSMGLVAKGTQLACIGAALGAANSFTSSKLEDIRKAKNPDHQPIMPVPTASANASGMAAFMGLSSTVRYNALGGFERLVTTHVGKLHHMQIITALGRVANGALGDSTRLHWLGLPKRGSVVIDPNGPKVEDTFADHFTK